MRSSPSLGFGIHILRCKTIQDFEVNSHKSKSMSLIVSISGIRGTIGGRPGNNLCPEDIVKFTSAFASLIHSYAGGTTPQVVIGRDARISGFMVNQLVSGTLQAMGIDVIDIGLASTPTVELAVKESGANGGIILTASHNPKQWNALKLLGKGGEFISAEEGVLLIEKSKTLHNYTSVDRLGTYHIDASWTDKHIERILELPLVRKDLIAEAGFRIALDPVNSVGAIAVPALLRALGVEDVQMINGEANGIFAHNPEPLPAHLNELSELCRKGADLGIAVDPDVDRLALVCEDGTMFGEEYTLVAVADYVLKNTAGNTVSNLSSSLALKDVTEGYGFKRYSSAVGEVNVVKLMKEVGAVIGGEGNGGVIYPPMHYGRDALTGIALFLSHLALSRLSTSELRAQYPSYFISKNRIDLRETDDVDELLELLAKDFASQKIDRRDGVWIDLGDEWIHLRKSNTEPIIRIYAESRQEDSAVSLAEDVIRKARKHMNHS